MPRPRVLCSDVMTVTSSAVFGLVFLALSVLATLTMYRFWGYDYDKERRKSACPRWKMNIHRLIGLAYVVLYVLFMIEMVPRLWTYQVEFPARTVAHICLGISIGVILFVKIAILRWFRHFEEWMPVLGTLLMLFSFLLVGLSVPFVLKERALAAGTLGAGAFSAESQDRVASLLPEAGFPDHADLGELATERRLRAGRQVLLNQCVYCHDLKTAIESPKTPAAWLRTVERMAEKPTLGPTISEREQHDVTAYLIAITPNLQRSEKARRHATDERVRAREAAEAVLPLHGPEPAEADPAPSADEAEESSEDDEKDDGAGESATPSEPDRSKPSTPEATDPDRDGGDAGDEAPGAGESREVDEHGDGEAERAEDPAEADPDDPEADAASEREAQEQRLAEAEATFESKCALCHGLDEVHTAPPASRSEARDLIHRMVDHGMSASEHELTLIEEHLVRSFVQE